MIFMADIFTKKKRSEVMSKIRSSHTKPEIVLREALRGYRFRYQPKSIIGNPDMAIRRLKVAVFVDGDFWHGGPPATTSRDLKPSDSRFFLTA